MKSLIWSVAAIVLAGCGGSDEVTRLALDEAQLQSAVPATHNTVINFASAASGLVGNFTTDPWIEPTCRYTANAGLGTNGTGYSLEVVYRQRDQRVLYVLLRSATADLNVSVLDVRNGLPNATADIGARTLRLNSLVLSSTVPASPSTATVTALLRIPPYTGAGTC